MILLCDGMIRVSLQGYLSNTRIWTPVALKLKVKSVLNESEGRSGVDKERARDRVDWSRVYDEYVTGVPDGRATFKLRFNLICSGMVIRNGFTESDDHLLIEFIAQVKPNDPGRLGKNLYISLEDSVDERPWAKRHSWQSWRERYKKNQDWFNHQIKKYQKKLREAQPQVIRQRPQKNEVIRKRPEESRVPRKRPEEIQVPRKRPEESQAPRKRPGESQVPCKRPEESKVPRQRPEESQVIHKRPEETEEESTSETEVREKLYAELFGTSRSSEEDEDDSDDAYVKLPAPPPSKDNIYPNIQSIPQPGSVLKEPHIPGSFDNVVKIEAIPILIPPQDPTPKSVISPGQISTPASATTALQSRQPSQHIHNKPKRVLLPREDDSNFFGTPSPSPSLPAPKPTAKHKLPMLLEGPFRSSLKRSRAASDNVTTDKSWPPKRMKKGAEDIDVSPDVEMSDARGITNSCFIIDKTNHDGRVASSGSRHSVSIKPMRRLTPNDGLKTAPPLPSIFPKDGDDPFMANKPLDMKKTNATYPVDNPKIHPRRINLRESLNATRRSRISSRASTSSTSGHSITSFLLPQDQELINQVGFSFVMAGIAKNYGFDVDVAKETFFKTKSIEETKSVLQDCKAAACMAANKRLARDSSSDETPQSRRGHSSSRKNSSPSNSGSRKVKSSSASRRANRPSLKFKPRPFDEEIDVLSEYSPPHVSRAGQFNRLVKEGRREEAIDREQRRASGVFIAQTQIQSYDEDQRQQSLSPLPNSSPIPKSGQELDIDGCDDDNDVQPPHMVPHEDPVQHQPPQEISSPVDIHQIFFERISEGRSSLNEDEDDPAVLKLAQEHRDLVMNVTEENADGLRRFEEQNNQDLLRFWSLDWVRQKIADM